MIVCQAKYIQDENILVVFGGLIFCIAIMWWIRIGDIKESKKLSENGLEIDSYTKSKSWRVYIIGGIGALIFLYEILKRFYNYLNS